MLAQHVYHAMVNDAVGKEWGNHQDTFLGVMYLSFLILAGYIRFIRQHFIQFIKPFANMLIEIVNLAAFTFAVLCVVLSQTQVFVCVEQVIIRSSTSYLENKPACLYRQCKDRNPQSRSIDTNMYLRSSTICAVSLIQSFQFSYSHRVNHYFSTKR